MTTVKSETCRFRARTRASSSSLVMASMPLTRSVRPGKRQRNSQKIYFGVTRIQTQSCRVITKVRFGFCTDIIKRLCSTVVEHMPHNQEVVHLSPARCWAFFLLLSFSTFLHQWSVLNQVPQGGASLIVSCETKH